MCQTGFESYRRGNIDNDNMIKPRDVLRFVSDSGSSLFIADNSPPRHALRRAVTVGHVQAAEMHVLWRHALTYAAQVSHCGRSEVLTVCNSTDVSIDLSRVTSWRH